MTNTDDRIDMTSSIERRLADLRSTPAPIMPTRPTDTSRNCMRGPRPSPKRRIIR